MQLIKRSRYRKNQPMGMFLCPRCGEIVEKQISNGIRDKSCGCFKKTQKGQSNSRLYHIWNGMISRCYNTKNNRFYCYGARGIRVCSLWKNNFLTFQKWALKNGYGKDLQIDRINNDEGYNPNNCRFVTRAKNIQNQNQTKLNHTLVSMIRKEYSTTKTSYRKLAKKYDVSATLIGYVITNKYWKDSGR